MLIDSFLHIYEYLLKTKKKIFIYGLGSNGLKILNKCYNYNINITGFIETNPKKKIFMGYPIYNINEISNINIILLISFAAKKQNDIDYILYLNKKYEIYYLYMSPFDNILFDKKIFYKNQKKIFYTYNLLKDYISKKIFINLINFRITGKINYLEYSLNNMLNNKNDLLNFNDNEVFIDIGAYNGDTIKEFLKINNNKFKKIYAFECDKKNFLKLKKNIVENNQIKLYNIAIFNKKTKVIISGNATRNTYIINNNNNFLYNQIKNNYYEIEADKLDNLIFEHPTYIKYDVEGTEMLALQGSKKIIKNYLPKLCISIYHKNNDMFDIPIFINQISKKYDFYIRQIPHIPCWDTMLYCIPKQKRCISF